MTAITHSLCGQTYGSGYELLLLSGNGNDQNFQGGYLPKFVGQEGGISVFRLRRGIYPPLEKPEVRLLASFRP